MVDLGSKVTKAQFRAWYMEERAKREALEKTLRELESALGAALEVIASQGAALAIVRDRRV